MTRYKKSHTITRRVGSALSLTLFLVAAPAWATGAADEAAAVSLFGEAKKLAASGDYEHACPKFVEANRLLPNAATALNVGDCYEKLGKLASAWGAFKQAEIAARNANDSDRQSAAAQRAQTLENRLPKVIILAPPNPPQGFEVRWDGRVVGEGQWGSPMPADPGAHMIEASMPGRQSWKTTVRVPATPGSMEVRIPRLEGGAGGSTDGVGTSGWSTQRTMGLVLGGAGLVGVVVGSVFGAKTLSNNSDSKTHCLPSDPTKCDAQGVALREDAYSAATVATTAFAVGGAALVGGVVVYLAAPSSSQATAGMRAVKLQPAIGWRSGSLSLQGEW